MKTRHKQTESIDGYGRKEAEMRVMSLSLIIRHDQEKRSRNGPPTKLPVPYFLFSGILQIAACISWLGGLAR